MEINTVDKRRKRRYITGKREAEMRKDGGKRKRKIVRVTEYLRDALLPLPHGAPLPGIREIMKRTGAGQLVVSRVLRELQSGGLIRIVPGSGIRRIVPVPRSGEIRLLHWQKYPEQGFVGKLFRRLAACAEASGERIVAERVGDRHPREVAEEFAAQGISRCVICGAHDPVWRAALSPRVEACLELMPLHSLKITEGFRDSPDMTAMQMDYLLKRGYRRIGYLHCFGEDHYAYPLHAQRLMDYYRIMAENGLRVDPAWVFRCSESYDDLEAGMARIASADPPPDALILPGIHLDRIYSFCRKHNIRIGEDLALFCCDDVNENLDPIPTTITNTPEAIAESFWEMFAAALRGEAVESRTSELMIRVGQTVPGKRPAKTDA